MWTVLGRILRLIFLELFIREQFYIQFLLACIYIFIIYLFLFFIFILFYLLYFYFIFIFIFIINLLI